MENALGYKIIFHNEGLDTHKRKKYNSFSNHVAQFSDQNKNIFLKIDIEGDEYKVFENKEFVARLDNVCQLVIEFHDLKNQLDKLISILGKID